MRLKFENYSLSGIDHRGVGFCLYLPGHSVGDSAMIVDVPTNQSAPLMAHFKANHPAVKITVVDEGPQSAVELPVVAVDVAEEVETGVPDSADDDGFAPDGDDDADDSAFSGAGRRNKRSRK